MQVITTVTQKGQITIPKHFRDALGMDDYGRVLVTKEKNYLKIMQKKDILDLAGSLKIPKKKGVLLARQALERSYQRF